MKFSRTLSVLAALITIAQQTPTAMAQQCDDISTYTTEWFLQNTRLEWRYTSFANALFYTAGLSEKARQFARQNTNKKITIWDVWPCQNYKIISTRNNPLKCIMSDPAQQMKYFENMSRAYAMKAVGAANVLHRNIHNPPMSTIWGRIELPVLQSENGAVNWITAIDAEDPIRRKIEWTRSMFERFLDEADSRYQQIIHGRDLSDVPADIAPRDDSEACEYQISEQHLLY